MVEIIEASNLKHPKGRFSLADPNGGIVLTDDTNMITNTVKDCMKSFVKNLMSGKMADAMRMRTPAFVHQPQTYLDVIRYEFSCLEQVLLVLNRNKMLDDPVERLKCITVA